MLQPFSNFEGWPEGSDGRKDAFERARGWIRIMKACGCSMLQVGSSDTPLVELDPGKIVPDLRELADMLKEHDFKTGVRELVLVYPRPRLARRLAHREGCR